MSMKKANSSKSTLGPWGGHGGHQWDDGVHKGVKQIVIIHAAAIDSIKFEYAKVFGSVWSETHGGTSGEHTDKIVLSFPEEKITYIGGHYGSISNGTPVIRSLTFQTNLGRKFGPYGREEGTYFSIPINGGKIVGFHGRSAWYLDSIGVHVVGATNKKLLTKVKDGCVNYIHKLSN